MHSRLAKLIADVKPPPAQAHVPWALLLNKQRPVPDCPVNVTCLDGGSLHVPPAHWPAFLKAYAADVDGITISEPNPNPNMPSTEKVVGSKFYLTEMVSDGPGGNQSCLVRAFFDIDLAEPTVAEQPFTTAEARAAAHKSRTNELAEFVLQAIRSAVRACFPSVSLAMLSRARAIVLTTSDKNKTLNDAFFHIGMHVVLPEVVITVDQLQFLTGFVIHFAQRMHPRAVDDETSWAKAIDTAPIHSRGSLRLPGSFKAKKCDAAKGDLCMRCQRHMGKPNCLKFVHIARSYWPEMVQSLNAADICARYDLGQLALATNILHLTIRPYPNDAKHREKWVSPKSWTALFQKVSLNMPVNMPIVDKNGVITSFGSATTIVKSDFEKKLAKRKNYHTSAELAGPNMPSSVHHHFASLLAGIPEYAAMVVYRIAVVAKEAAAPASRVGRNGQPLILSAVASRPVAAVSESIIVYPSRSSPGSNFCMHKKAAHASNGIFFEVSFKPPTTSVGATPSTTPLVHMRCFDTECPRKGVAIPNTHTAAAHAAVAALWRSVKHQVVLPGVTNTFDPAAAAKRMRMNMAKPALTRRTETTT